MNLAVGTVRKYAYAESFPVHEARPLRPSILDPHLVRLQARLAAGHENGLALWRELRAAGFTGTAKQVHNVTNISAQNPSETRPLPGRE
jgi:hypothetical protein